MVERLPIDDPGFDYTVLAEFRIRVADAGLGQVALDALLYQANNWRLPLPTEPDGFAKALSLLGVT